MVSHPWALTIIIIYFLVALWRGRAFLTSPAGSPAEGAGAPEGCTGMKWALALEETNPDGEID